MSYQKWMKWESERIVINGLYGQARSFTDLVDLTDLSKPVLSQRLKELKREGKVEIVPDVHTKRFLYHLAQQNLDTIDELYIKVHILSEIVMTYLTEFAKDSSISDEKYATYLMQGVSMLFDLRLKSYLTAPVSVQKEWLKNTLGLEFVKNMAQLFPENREVLRHTTKSMPSRELAIFKTKDIKEAANQLVDFLNRVIEKISQR